MRFRQILLAVSKLILITANSAVILLWLESYSVVNEFVYTYDRQVSPTVPSDGWTTSIRFECGGVECAYRTYAGDPEGPEFKGFYDFQEDSRKYPSPTAIPGALSWTAAGFGAASASWSDTVASGYTIAYRHRSLWMPAWIPALVSFILSVFLVRSLRGQWFKYKNRNKSPCPTCSYDLRAHNPGDKCPECGNLIPLPFSPKTSIQ